MDLTDYVILPGGDYKAACDAVREKTGRTDGMRSGELAAEIRSIAPKLQEKTAVPSDAEQVITPDTGFDALSRVIVAAAQGGVAVRMTEKSTFALSGYTERRISCGFVPDLVFITLNESGEYGSFCTAIPFAQYSAGGYVDVAMWSGSEDCYVYEFRAKTTADGFAISGCGFDAEWGEVLLTSRKRFEYIAVKYTA